MIIDHTFLECGHRAAGDLRLSNKALGMHQRVMEYRTEDRLSVDKIVAMLREVNEKSDGRFAILAAFKELEELGYVVRVRSRDAATGTWTVLTTVYGCPHTECKNLFGMESGKLGHTKPPVDMPPKALKIPQPRHAAPEEQFAPDPSYGWSHRVQKPKADNPTLIGTAQAQPENQSQERAPRSEDRTAGGKAGHATQVADDAWPEVAELGIGLRLTA